MTTSTIGRFRLPRFSFPRLTLRSFYRIPVLGWIARDLIEGDADNLWYLLVALVSLWIIAVMIWGLPALYLPAVLLAPLAIVMLVLLTLG